MLVNYIINCIINSLRAADLYIDPNAGGSVCDGHIHRS